MSAKQYIEHVGYDVQLELFANTGKNKQLYLVTLIVDSNPIVEYAVVQNDRTVLLTTNPILAAETYDNL